MREKYCWLAGGWKLVLELGERKILLSWRLLELPNIVEVSFTVNHEQRSQWSMCLRSACGWAPLYSNCPLPFSFSFPFTFLPFSPDSTGSAVQDIFGRASWEGSARFAPRGTAADAASAARGEARQAPLDRTGVEGAREWWTLSELHAAVVCELRRARPDGE